MSDELSDTPELDAEEQARLEASLAAAIPGAEEGIKAAAAAAVLASEDTEDADGDEDVDAPADDENVSVLDLPGKPQPPLRVEDLLLEELGEIDNVRPEYYGIEELAESMHMNTLLEPIIVRPTPDDAEHDKPYEVVCGYRRKRAAERLGWERIRAEIRDIESPEDLLSTMITENIQRENLSPMAEANAIRQMMEVGGLTQAAVARLLGKHPSHISHRLSLFRLPDTVKTAVDEGRLSVSHAEKIAELDDADQQEKFAAKAMRTEAPVKKLAAWVNEVKNPEPAGLEDLAPLEEVMAEDVQELPRLHPRDGISDIEIERLTVYQMLRNGNDIEVLEWLLEEHNIVADHLWHYVMALQDNEVAELKRTLALRYVSSATRYPSLEPELIDSFDAPPEGYELSDEQISLDRLVAPHPELMPVRMGPLASLGPLPDEPLSYLDEPTGLPGEVPAGPPADPATEHDPGEDAE